MACYRPLRAWRAPGGGATFNPKEGFTDLPLLLPCGQCIGCRLERSREWATRCMHEAQLHEHSCFLTLTYDDAHLPKDRSLVKTEFPRFMRRLRKAIRRPVKYFHCGEYGETTRRPHYHAILFGHDFSDKRRWKTTPDGHVLWCSKELDRFWGLGFCSIGAVTFETAAYTARYVTKKITGAQAAKHYQRVDDATGELVELVPEFMTCSRGLGERWIERYSADTYRDDYVICRGHPSPVPRYYDKKFSVLDPAAFRRVQLARISSNNTATRRYERTPERLEVHEAVTTAALAIRAREPK